MRRDALRLGFGGLLGLGLGGCRQNDAWYGVDVSGTLPELRFTMTRAGDAATVDAGTYRGQIVALFFGYTNCPGICPMTLANLSAVADALGTDAAGFSILFVTVDPGRDSLAAMEAYANAFSPRTDALRGSDNQLAALARRYRVTYKLGAHRPGDTDYKVSHGKTVYLFDARGAARLLWPDFATAAADIPAAVRDLRRLRQTG